MAVRIDAGAVVTLAWLGYRRTRTEADFIVAGRSLGALLGGATLAATQISAGTFVGTVGLHYLAGVSFAWAWPGAWLGWFVAAVFVAPKLRDLNLITVGDYFHLKFGPLARELAVVNCVIFLVGALAAQMACSTALPGSACRQRLAKASLEMRGMRRRAAVVSASPRHCATPGLMVVTTRRRRWPAAPGTRRAARGKGPPES